MITTAVLAGRRLSDADGAFPARFVPSVRERLRALFVREGVGRLICAAADGADLIALDLAASLGIERRIVIADGLDGFRAGSVAPAWQPLFDRMVAKAPPTVVRGTAVLSRYRAVTRHIVDLAAHGQGRVVAVVVWDGRRRGAGDHTADFAGQAKARGMIVRQIPIRRGPHGA